MKSQQLKYFLPHFLAQIMAQALPPDGNGQFPSQQQSATMDATNIAKILAKTMKILILIKFCFEAMLK